MCEQLKPAEHAYKCWNMGLDRTANPYAKGTTCWEMWADEFMRLYDEYMAKIVDDE
jgi:hypothetical protein